MALSLYGSGNISSGTTTGISILTNGYVRKPNAPAYYAQGGTQGGSGSGSYGNFNGVWYTSGHATTSTFDLAYNHTRFICPVAGLYLVWIGDINQNISTTARHYIRKNGSTVSGELRNPQTTNHGTSASFMALVNCAVGDWLAGYGLNDSGSMAWYDGTYSHFGVWFVG